MEALEMVDGNIVITFIESESGRLWQAHIMLNAILEKYFSSTSVEDSDRAYIFAVLNAVDDIVFEFSRDLDAAFGIETAEVQTFIKNTREIYGQFIDKPND